MRALFCFLLLLAASFGAEGDKDPKAEDRKKVEELLKDAETNKGFVTIVKKEGKVLLELAASDFDRPFLWFESVSRGVGRGRALGGMTLGSRLVSLRRISKEQIQLLEENPRFRAAPGTPVERAVRNSFGPSILATVPVLARHPDRDALYVDLGALLFADLPAVARSLKGALGTEFKLDRAGCSWVSAKTFPKNAEFEVSLAFQSNETEDLETVPDARGVEVRVHYGIAPLPENGYRPRRADDRVGYFLTAIKDFSQPGLHSFARFIDRWHLEKADPSAAVSPPKDPIVFWIENTVPYEVRKWVRDGILEWNRAFERIGIRDAIEVRQMEEDADWDPEDARYNTFRWITSSRPSFGAMGPHRADPRTGQILDADILYEAENYRGLVWGYLRDHLGSSGPGEEPWFLASPHDGDECRLELLREPEHAFATTALLLLAIGQTVPEEFAAQAVKETVMHEVGHTLGLRHNFKASTTAPLEKLHDRAYAEKEGLFGSVMEYNPPNVSRDPAKQGYYFSPTLGAYDYWAIEYGYRPLPAEGEEEALRKIASRSNEPGLPYATDEDTYGPSNLDPEATVFDLSGDPLAWCRERIALCEELWSKDWSRLNEPGYGYRLHRSAMQATLTAYRRAVEIAARWVGGVRMDRRHPGDGGAPFRNVPIGRQREALRLVVEKAFAPDLFRFPPERLNVLAPNRHMHWGVDEDPEYAYPLGQQVRDLRRALLARLHDPSVLRHIDEAQARALPGEPPMTIGELLRTVTAAIWPGAKGAAPIPADLRVLQADHVEALGRLLGGGDAVPLDASNLARRILGELRAARPPGDGDEATEAHLAAIAARIDELLHVSVTRPAR